MHDQRERFECPTDGASPVLTVHPLGQLDLASSGVLRSVLLKALADQPEAIIVDLSGITVHDDVCLTLFSTLARRAATWPGCALVLCGATPPVAERMRQLGLQWSVTTYPTWSDARLHARHEHRVKEIRERFAPKPESLAAARALAAAGCAEWQVPQRIAGLVQVVLTELVGNAVRHAGTPMEVVLRRTAQYIHVSVHDQDRRHPRLCGPETPDAEGGRGLMVVEALAASWGSAPTRDGKVVWATVRHKPVTP